MERLGGRAAASSSKGRRPAAPQAAGTSSPASARTSSSTRPPSRHRRAVRLGQRRQQHCTSRPRSRSTPATALAPARRRRDRERPGPCRSASTRRRRASGRRGPRTASTTGPGPAATASAPGVLDAAVVSADRHRTRSHFGAGTWSAYRQIRPNGEQPDRVSLLSSSTENVLGNARQHRQRRDAGRQGRHVSCPPAASNLVPGDTNGKTDVFFRDELTRRVSVADRRHAGDGDSTGGSISKRRPLRRVLLRCHEPGSRRHQRRSGRVRPRPARPARRSGQRPSRRRAGEQRQLRRLDLDDGRYVEFQSFASNLISQRPRLPGRPLRAGPPDRHDHPGHRRDERHRRERLQHGRALRRRKHGGLRVRLVEPGARRHQRRVRRVRP